MLQTLLAKVVGTQNERELKRLRPLVGEVNAFEPEIEALSDEQLRAKTAEFRQRVANGETLDDLLHEAFAVVREAGRRALNMRHFDVQLIGGAVLHTGKIAEMKTGEGKTLVATLPAYLNALEGKGVHVVTVNDYLARRDSEWMGRIYRFLGMSVGVIQHDLTDAERQVAYAADITYGTNNEFGFDYLRDNMKFELSQYVQRGHQFAIVDEVDSILIDEARTPLIISGPAEESTELYYEVDRIIPRLKPGAVIRGDTKAEEREAIEATGDYIVDEKHKTVTLTESGIAKAEQALPAHALFHRDVDYMVKDGEVVIVDEFTGRLMPGRRWSDGLHQAVEAKEKVKIERENQTLATVTFQNYFRKYKTLAGMTGTADTEAEEFAKIYKLDVVVIPPNRTLRRVENPDLVYRTEKEKWDAIVTEIVEEHAKGRPVLVGTVSIEKSEKLSAMLDRRGLKRGTTTGGGADKHVVLNAKYHAQEAEFVAQAGRKGAVTIATNMAGRGTDILLGGNAEFMARQQCLAEEIAERLSKGEERFVKDEHYVYFYHLDAFYRVPKAEYERIFQHFKRLTDAEHDEVVALSGLHILATERHEARRIDNQLRGRAGRQGDPGSSRFYLSLEDDLMRIFGGERVKALMFRLGMTEGVPIESRLISSRIENAQKSVEAQNFDARKHLLEYDDVMHKQRETIYALRRSALEGKDQRDYVLGIAEDVVRELVETFCPSEQHPDQWNVTQFLAESNAQFGVDIKAAGADPVALAHDELAGAAVAAVTRRYEEKEKQFGADLMRWLERRIILDVVDSQWKDHLLSLDHLKEGIGLRGYAQKDPIVEFKKEAFTLFEDMMARIDNETIRYLFHIQMQQGEQPPEARRPESPRTPPQSAAAAAAGAAARVNEPQHLPSVAREIERRQQRQQKDWQYQTGPAQAEAPKPVRVGAKVGRNDPCPCGSGKKYKKCHGANV